MNVTESIGMNNSLNPNKGCTEHDSFLFFQWVCKKNWLCNNNFHMVNLPKMEIVISVEVLRIEDGSLCMGVCVYETSK